MAKGRNPEQWMKEIKAALKRERDYRKCAQEAVEIYESDKPDKTPFNILFSNTETILPALYNATPRADVRSRFKHDVPVAVAGAKLCQTLLDFTIDNGDPNYEVFDNLMIQAVRGALVPGRGVTFFKYEAEIEYDKEENPIRTRSETVCGEDVPWDRFICGYAHTWIQVPWAGRIHYLNREEAKARFKEKASKLNFTSPEDSDSAESPQLPSGEKATGVELACVYEIWDKTTKKQLFLHEGMEEFLEVNDDPYKLEGFFPFPEPIQLIKRFTSLTPQTLYQVYRNQAAELNRITTRIQRIIEALKVRGFYDSRVEAIREALTQEDNILLPVQNVGAMMGQGGKLEDAVFTFPIEKYVNVLQQLYIQREQVKQVIFEVLGIADILRGASVASETATAQNIKAQWGGLRLKRFQKAVSHYVRDCLRIVAELSFSHYSPDTIRQMTGSTLPPAAQKQQAQVVAQELSSRQQPVPPQVSQVLEQPAFEEVLQVLQTKLLRRYNIDIETDSTVDAEATGEKEAIGEFMNAFSQLLAGLGPLMQDQTLPFEAAKEIMLAVVKRYRFGREVEDKLREMQPPQPQADPKQLEQQAKDLEQQAQQIEQQTRALEDKKREIELAGSDLDHQKQMLQAQAQQMEERLEMAVERAMLALERREAEVEAAALVSSTRSQIQSMGVQAKEQTFRAKQVAAKQTQRPKVKES